LIFYSTFVCFIVTFPKRTGYKVQLTCKAMDQGLDLPHNWEQQITSLKDAVETIITGGEREASKAFLTMVSGEVKRCDGVVYARIGGIWTCEKDRVRDSLVVKALDANMCTLDPSGKPLLYSSRLSCAEAIVRAAMMRIHESPDFVEELWRSSKGKLCFQDGYWKLAWLRLTHFPPKKADALTTTRTALDRCCSQPTSEGRKNNSAPSVSTLTRRNPVPSCSTTSSNVRHGMVHSGSVVLSSLSETSLKRLVVLPLPRKIVEPV
jgi:hypothetical protein